MAGNEQQGDRTEKPTTKRKKDARERGQVARSRDLAGAISLVAATGAVGWLGARVVGLLGGRLGVGLNAMADQAHATLTPASIGGSLWSDMGLLAAAAGPPAL